MLTYATRFEDGTPLPAEPVELGDSVRQQAYGKGLGRLEDCGRLGIVTAIHRTRVVVDFGPFIGTQRVSPSVLRREGA